MLKRLAFVAALLAASISGVFAQTGVTKPKSSLNSEVPQQIPDNVSGAVNPSNVRQVMVDSIASWQQAPLVNAQTGASYTFLASDYGQLVTFNNAGAIAATLPAASGAFFPWNVYVANLGAGTVTITPQGGSTIAGASTFTVTTGASFQIVSDGTNYQVIRGFASNAQLANMAAGTVKCRETGNGTGAPQDCAYPTIVITDAPYNADPTGVLDSTTAIQNAINACPASTLYGCTVLFPIGNYTANLASLGIGNGNGAATASTTNGIYLVCAAPTRPGLNGVSGTPGVGPCNINSSFAGPVIKVNGTINGWGLRGISITSTTTNTSSGCLAVVSGSFGTVENFMCNNVPGVGILEFVGASGASAVSNSWRNIQVRMLPASATAVGIQLSSNSATQDIFGGSWDNVNVIPTAAGQQCLAIGASDSESWNRILINPGSCSIVFNYTQNAAFPSGHVFTNFDTGTGNTVSNNGTPNASAAPNYMVALNTANNGTIPNLANLAVFAHSKIVLSNRGVPAGINGQIAIDANGHLGFSGTAPTITAGCTGAGSSVNGNDMDGTVIGANSGTPTTCTITFANTFANGSCGAWGLTAPLTGLITRAAGTLQVNFPATNSFVWSYHCASIN